MLNEANQESLEKIVNLRYNESIEINSADFEDIDFNFGTSFNVYTGQVSFYKKLPVGINYRNKRKYENNNNRL